MATSASGRGLPAHPRMPLSERAKIFVPFDPLKGFQEALRAKEAEVEAARLADRVGRDPAAPTERDRALSDALATGGEPPSQGARDERDALGEHVQ